ncbi:MAG: heavy-metal-associated domain-containing protein [Pseudomonadota bacterium]
MLKSLTAFTLALASTFAAAQANQSITMKVDGLVCAFCAQGIEKKLKGFAATDGVYVNLEHGLVAMGLKTGTDVPDAELTSTLTDAGYTVKGISRSAQPLSAIQKEHGE